ncbi:MAG TPA: TonB-dependent receptor, partial [Chitinophagaceae bacterium]|nr:TonB-dependent receptor [Chitinophagaceae bacterium]
MKRRLTVVATFLLLFYIPGSLLAQSKIRGHVTDMNDKPIAGATVLMLNSADSVLVKGTVTSNTGQYFFDNVTTGRYFISSSYVGFSPVSIATFQVTSNNVELDQGVVKLEPLSSALANVTVTAKRPLYEQRPDRLTINVANSITAAGNTALEVLERSPGVVVNRQNNTIAIQGKEGVNIMINGKLTYMPASAVMQLLDGMSAGNIDKIELITTPPANFDAEGKAGYINIILKQNNNFGTNGSFSGTLGYGQGWVTQANLNFNHRKGKVNIYGDFSYSRVKSEFPALGYTRISNNGDIYETYGKISRMDTTRNHNVRLGLDYQLTNRTIIGILLTSNGRWYRQAEEADALF